MEFVFGVLIVCVGEFVDSKRELVRAEALLGVAADFFLITEGSL